MAAASVTAGRMLRPALCAVLVGLAAILPWAPAAAETPTGQTAQALPLTVITIVTAKGRHRLEVEVAATAPAREKGLMFRPSLPRDGAMLFDFETSRPVAMWMKNTLMPLDMLFVAGDGRIVNIANDTIPFSLRPIASDGPVRAVLEVNAGTASRLGIKPGDRLEHAMFSGADGADR